MRGTNTINFFNENLRQLLITEDDLCLLGVDEGTAKYFVVRDICEKFDDMGWKVKLPLYAKVLVNLLSELVYDALGYEDTLIFFAHDDFPFLDANGVSNVMEKKKDTTTKAHLLILAAVTADVLGDRLYSVKEPGTAIFNNYSELPRRISMFLSQQMPALEANTLSQDVVAFISGCTELTSYISPPEHMAPFEELFNDLPYYWRPWLLYFSVFPPDYQISVRQMILLWVVEGFIHEGSSENMEDSANEFLEMLAHRSLIKVVQRKSNGRVKKCSIAGPLLDFCIYEAERVRFLTFHRSVESVPLTNPLRLVGNGYTIDHMFYNTHSCRRLRSLLCFGSSSGKSKEWIRLFINMTFLRVFKVIDAGMLPREVESLLLLKYLGLDKNSYLQDPSSLRKLLNLQILDARSEFSPPAEIWNLKKLRHVYFQGPTIFPQPPPSSSDDDFCLENLETLSTISASSCTALVFAKLPNLLKLGVEGDLNELSSDNLVKLKHLRTLKMVRLAGFPPPKSLPREFPANLTKLTLRDTKLQEDPMELLGGLTNLQILKLLSNAYIGDKMVCSSHEFPELRILKLVTLESISELIIKERALPKLDRLLIHDCEYLGIVQGLEYASTLKIIQVKNPSTELREQIQQCNEKEKYQLQIYEDD